MVARAVHSSRPRKDKPFVALNCGAIPRHAHRVRAVRPRAGRLHRRRPAAPRQLRARPRRHALPRRDWASCRSRCRPSSCASSRSGRFRRLGGKSEVEVDVRVLCATNRDLKEEIKKRPLPRGPLLPAATSSTIHLPPLQGAARGRAAPRPALRREVQRRDRASTSRASRPTAHGGAAGLRLAGQHPRAAQHGGARDDPLRRRHHRRGAPAARHAAGRGREAAMLPGAARPPAATTVEKEYILGLACSRTAATRRAPPRCSGSARRRSTTSSTATRPTRATGWARPAPSGEAAVEPSRRRGREGAERRERARAAGRRRRRRTHGRPPARAPGALGGVERGVGADGPASRRDPRAARRRSAEIPKEAPSGTSCPRTSSGALAEAARDALGEHARLRAAGVRQEQDELVAAVARAEVGLAQLATDHRPRPRAMARSPAAWPSSSLMGFRRSMSTITQASGV